MSVDADHISGEDLGELRVKLLRELWIKATMALTDTVGAKSALDVLSPYFVHHAKYTSSLVQSHHLKRSTPEEIYYGCAQANQAVNHTKVSGELREKGVLYKAVDCGTRGASSVACICNCRLTTEPMLEDLNSEYGILMNQSLSEGDPLCSWVIARKGRSHMTDIGDKIADLGPPPLDRSFLEETAPAILGEFWTIATRSFVEAVGHEKAKEVLVGRQRILGRDSAAELILSSGSKEGTMRDASTVVGFLS